MRELDTIVADAVAVAAGDGDEQRDAAAANVAAFMDDDNASMMGGWT